MISAILLPIVYGLLCHVLSDEHGIKVILVLARAAAKKVNSYFKGLFGDLDRNLRCYASEVAVNQSLFTIGRSIYGIYSYSSLLVCRLNSGSCAQS